MTDKIVDPIKAAQKKYQRDCLTANKVLFAIRCGADVEIMHDPETGWELSGPDLPVYMPLETGEQVVNMILGRLVGHYRELSALLGNPDSHDLRLLSLK